MDLLGPLQFIINSAYFFSQPELCVSWGTLFFWTQQKQILKNPCVCFILFLLLAVMFSEPPVPWMACWAFCGFWLSLPLTILYSALISECSVLSPYKRRSEMLHLKRISLSTSIKYWCNLKNLKTRHNSKK